MCARCLEKLTSGCLSDCSLRFGAGTELSPHKVCEDCHFLSRALVNYVIQCVISQYFKCHKIILSKASEVFDTMFSNKHYKEAQSGPEHPILFDEYDQQVGEVALR